MSELNDLMQEARAGSAAAQATLAAPIDCVKVSLILWQFQFHMFHPPPPRRPHVRFNPTCDTAQTPYVVDQLSTPFPLVLQ